MHATLPPSEPSPAGDARERRSSRSRLTAARCTAIAALLWANVGRAEPAVPDGVAGAEADARYRQGIAEFEGGHWREAVELFKQADALAPSQWLSFNIAKVFERMRDSRSALAWYRDYVRRSLDAAPLPDVLERIGELEAELEAQGIQQLSVLSTPPGATVLLDGESRGVTPYTGELPPGAHLLELRLRGHHDTWRELTLPPDHAIDVELVLAESDDDAPGAPEPGAGEPTMTSSGGLVSATPSAVASGGLTPEPSRTASWWTWGLFGGSAALLLGAGAVELSRHGLEDDAREATNQIDYAHAYDEVESRRDTARVLLGAGALLGIAGGVSLYLDLRSPSPDSTALGLGCEREVCGLLARHAW